MTVETTSTYAGPYALNGVATAFPFSFKALTAAEVGVEIDGATVDPLTYSVQLTSQGGTAVFSVPPVGVALYVVSQPDFRQGISFSNQSAFLPASHNEANDRAAVRDQVLAEGLSRAVQLPLGEVAAVLPPAAARAGGNKILAPDPITGAITILDGSAFIGSPGLPNNTYTSYSALLASDPTKQYAFLVGDTDSPPRADGAYTNPTKTAGGWLPAKDVITPQDLGAVADGTTPAQNAFLALSATNRPMLVPPGDYFIDNSSIRQINNYTGELTFSPGARLIFSDNTKKGLYFVGGSPKIRGVTLTTAEVPTTRQLDAPMIDLYLCTDPIISDVVVERGAGAGVLVRTCTGLRANNIVVRNTLADGMDLFNCSDFQVSNVLTDTTGDDGLAALDYADQPVSQRGILTNIIALRSNARGITINGPTNVTLDGFHIEETQGTGLMIEEDSSAGIRIPTGIKASNGTIKRAGQRVTNPGYTGNKYGVEIGQSGTVDLVNIVIGDCKYRGVSAVSTQGNAHLTTIGVKVETAGAQGFNIDGQTAWTFDDILAQDTAAEGIYTHDVKRLVGGLRTVVRAAKTGGNFRAIHDNSNTFMSVEKNVIVDDQATATGYVYRADGGTQGSVGTFDWLVGVFYYDNFAPYLVNKGHSGPRRDGLSMPTGTPEIINATSTLDRYILGALTADKDFTLPQNGQFHGMVVSVARYDVSGTNTVRLIDPNNSNAVVTTIPAGTGAVPTKASVWWDATGTPPQFRAGGKIPL